MELPHDDRHLEAERLSCRSCGAPRSLDLRCASCGEAAPELGEREVLLEHRDRLRRALQRLQAVAASGWIAETESTKPRQFVIVATFVLTAGAIFGSLGQLDPGGCLMAVVFVPALWFVAYKALAFFDGRVSRRAFRETDDLIESLRVSEAVRCASCRGFATGLVFDDDSPPCPWCGGALVASAGQLEAKGDAVRRETAAREAATRELLHRARQRQRTERSGSQTDSAQDVFFRRQRFFGASVWRSLSGRGATMAERYEVDRKTGLGRRLFFVREEMEAPFRELAASWRVPLPEHPAGVVETATDLWRVYSDEPGELTPGEGLALVPYDLEAQQCLLVDRAGASSWVLGAHLETPEERFEEILGWLGKGPGEG